MKIDLNLTPAEITLLDDAVSYAAFYFIGVITGNIEGDKAWAERRHIELVALRRKLIEQQERYIKRHSTKTPEKAWADAIEQVNKAWGENE